MSKAPIQALSAARAQIVSAPRSVLSSAAVRMSPVPGSRLVDMSFTDPDPGSAQRVANALADAFVAANLDKRLKRIPTPRRSSRSIDALETTAGSL